MGTVLLAAFVAEALVLSAAFKLVRWRDYLDALASYTAVLRFPKLLGLVKAIAWSVPVVECAIAAALVVPRSQTDAAAASFVLFLLFYVLLGTDERPLIANCGCWGRTSIAVPKAVYLSRNILFLIAALALCILNIVVASHTGLLDSVVAFIIALPFSMLVLELPQIAQVVAVRPSSS
jgi:hypothetical protein